MIWRAHRIAPGRRGGYDLHLPDEERELLAVLPGRVLPGIDAISGPDTPGPKGAEPTGTGLSESGFEPSGSGFDPSGLESQLSDSGTDPSGPNGSSEAEQTAEDIASMGLSDASIPSALRRLFPPAYLSDDKAESTYREFVRPELAAHHREALELLRATCHRTHLDEEEVQGWLCALTDLRLVIGTALGVTEDEHEVEPDDPTYFEWVCYHYLSALQHEIVEAVSGQLPPPIDDGDDLLEDPWGEPPGGLRWDGTNPPEST